MDGAYVVEEFTSTGLEEQPWNRRDIEPDALGQLFPFESGNFLNKIALLALLCSFGSG
jgi:hypothetical protein